MARQHLLRALLIFAFLFLTTPFAVVILPEFFNIGKPGNYNRFGLFAAFCYPAIGYFTGANLLCPAAHSPEERKKLFFIPAAFFVPLGLVVLCRDSPIPVVERLLPVFFLAPSWLAELLRLVASREGCLGSGLVFFLHHFLSLCTFLAIWSHWHLAIRLLLFWWVFTGLSYLIFWAELRFSSQSQHPPC